MDRLTELLRRVLALMSLGALLFGVPLTVFRMVGNPLPSAPLLRQAWSGDHIDGELAIRVGLTVFAALWTWFALTAIAELWQVLVWRLGSDGGRYLAPLPAGPSGWVRALVRVVALSTVAVASTVGSMGGAGPVSAEASPRVHVVQRPTDTAVVTPLGTAHRVVAGDSYWKIADEHLTATFARDATPREVLEYTEALMSFNHPLLGHRDPPMIMPGELVVYIDADVTEAPAAAPTIDLAEPKVPTEPTVQPALDRRPVQPEAVLRPLAPNAPSSPRPPDATRPADVVRPADAPPGSSTSAPYAAGLGTALMVSAGAIGVIETRRRRRLRAAAVGSRLIPPTATQVQTERLLRTLDASERVAQLDLAVRAAGPALAAQSASILGAVVHELGEIRLFLRGSATPEHAMFTLDPHANTWCLQADVSLAELAPLARLCAQPCPALAHLGATDDGGELFVDLEAIGTLTVRSPYTTPILRALAASLAVSPLFDGSHLLTVGLVAAGTSDLAGESFESVGEAVDAATRLLGNTTSVAGHSTTFQLRAMGSGGESWEPAVVIATHPGGTPLDAVIGGRGSALVIGDDVDECASEWRLDFVDGGHVVQPLGLRVQPVGISEADVAAVADLLDHTGSTSLDEAEAEPRVEVTSIGRAVEPFEEQDWAFTVRTFGGIEIVSRDGVVVGCERSKATELIVWLSQHRERPTRSAARTALWDLDVRDATFANVVSDARRALARAVAPAEGEEWIARTLSDNLPLHPRAVTDAELLAARVAHARGLAALDATTVLRPGVELLGGMPFAGTNYLWTDAEGISSSLALLALNAAADLAGHYLVLGDVEGVFWATGQGLKVLTGHEELIALRMRAHAQLGDLAGVRNEWESYERAIAADPWAAAEPSVKLVRLRYELLAPSTATAARLAD